MLTLTTASTEKYEVSQIALYPDTAVDQIAALISKARAKLGGISTGIGFWGSPGWVLGGVAVLGLLEGMASKAAATEGINLLTEANLQIVRLKKSQEFFSPEEIENINIPDPDFWAAKRITSTEHDLSNLVPLERRQFLSDNGLLTRDIRDNKIFIRKKNRFVQTGDFLLIKSNERELFLRWSAVITWQYDRPVIAGN
jgi:hypothetical protein